MRSSPRMTRTVSGRMSSSRRTSLTRRLPATSTSRRGLRSTTFIGLRGKYNRIALPSRRTLTFRWIISRLRLGIRGGKMFRQDITGAAQRADRLRPARVLAPLGVDLRRLQSLVAEHVAHEPEILGHVVQVTGQRVPPPRRLHVVHLGA